MKLVFSQRLCLLAITEHIIVKRIILNFVWSSRDIQTLAYTPLDILVLHIYYQKTRLQFEAIDLPTLAASKVHQNLPEMKTIRILTKNNQFPTTDKDLPDRRPHHLLNNQHIWTQLKWVGNMLGCNLNFSILAKRLVFE